LQDCVSVRCTLQPVVSVQVRVCWFEHEQADQPPQDQLGVH